MQKWEYATLQVDWVPSKKVFLPRALNDKEYKGWQDNTTSLHQILNELGDDGWELVTTYRDAGALIFKRPKK